MSIRISEKISKIQNNKFRIYPKISTVYTVNIFGIADLECNMSL